MGPAYASCNGGGGKPPPPCQKARSAPAKLTDCKMINQMIFCPLFASNIALSCTKEVFCSKLSISILYLIKRKILSFEDDFNPCSTTYASLITFSELKT